MVRRITSFSPCISTVSTGMKCIIHEYSRCPSLTPYHVSALSALKPLKAEATFLKRAPCMYVQALETANTLSSDHKEIVQAF